MRSRWFGLVITALAVALSLWALPELPERVATHWNARGQVDGYSPKLVAAFVLPLVILGLNGLFRILPKIDPRRANYDAFIDSYWLIANAVVLFLGAVHALVVVNGLGHPVSVARAVPLGVGVLFMFLGNYLSRVEPNWFVGIRTPWTLSSDRVWRKTHRTGGWVFVLGGLALAATAFAPPPAVLPVVVTVLAAVGLIPVVQSYVLWKREAGK